MDKQSIRDKVNQVKLALSELAEKVEQLPPNPNVEQLGNNCISLKLSELNKHDKWSPDYYIFSAQYKVIADAIREVPIEHVLIKLDSIVRAKHYYTKGNTIIFHPMVIENLKSLIN